MNMDVQNYGRKMTPQIKTDLSQIMMSADNTDDESKSIKSIQDKIGQPRTRSWNKHNYQHIKSKYRMDPKTIAQSLKLKNEQRR